MGQIQLNIDFGLLSFQPGIGKYVWKDFTTLAEYYFALSENLDNNSFDTGPNPEKDCARLHNVTVYHKTSHIQERFSGDGRVTNTVFVTNVDPFCLT